MGGSLSNEAWAGNAALAWREMGGLESREGVVRHGVGEEQRGGSQGCILTILWGLGGSAVRSIGGPEDEQVQERMRLAWG